MIQTHQEISMLLSNAGGSAQNLTDNQFVYDRILYNIS